VAYYAVGYTTGSAFFCGTYMWTYSGAIPGIIVALGLPVALFYFALLMVIRSRKSVLVGRAGLFACGIGVGLFPMLGLWPIYMWRLPFALILFVIHIAILTAILFSVHFATRRMKATHAV
jgi:uncharacterized membrane protein (UPF0136 family)